MSIGTFADRATRNHIRQTTKQKKIVFGERPLTISAQSLKNSSSYRPEQMSTSQNIPSSTTQNMSSQAHELNANQGKSQSPWYIISQDKVVLWNALNLFRITMGIVSVPSVILTLFFIAFGFKDYDTLKQIYLWVEILFFLEIIQHFFTAYKDTETFESVYSLKKIATNYIINGSFLVHVLAAFPYQLIIAEDLVNEPEQNVLRNILMFKMLRLMRINTDFIPDEVLLNVLQSFYRDVSRDDKIANDRYIINIIKIIKQVLMTMITTYFLGLLWYRFSDHWQAQLVVEEPEERYWVVYFNLRRPSYEEHLGEQLSVAERMITCMYYALTTLSTVGYGDFHPYSIAEKIVGSIIQIFGVTFFSILMNGFIDVVLSIKGSNFSNNEDTLQRWFMLIKKIRNQPFGGGQNISPNLRDHIEQHFRYFWENDRTAVLLEKKEYFDSIPFKIQEHIMCKFLFQDIIDRPAFRTFFRLGSEFDSNFVYEVAFGFMPRQFQPSPDDRYILEEEGDVTEIYFIIKGEWAIGYNSFAPNLKNSVLEQDNDEAKGPDDMMQKGILIAMRRVNYGYIGDYYVLASKRSQFYYVALSPVESFALTKQFIFKTIFKKFPGLHSEMLAESFSRYIKEFRKPCGKKRAETIKSNNMKSAYTRIDLENHSNNPMRNINKQFKNNQAAGKLKRRNSRTKIFEKQEELRQYKCQLDILNEKANTMFEHMKQINKLVNKKIMDIESHVTKSEAIFVDEINTLIKNKQELQKIQHRNYSKAQR